MRFMPCVPVLLFIIVVVSGQSRQKRFLRPDSLAHLPESFFRIGEYARDLTDQISGQTSMAIQQMMPQAERRPLFAALSSPRRREEVYPEKPYKRAGVRRIPVGRETEGDEKDIEVFDPETVEKPQRPDDSSEESWFRPLVPFSFSFGLLKPWWQGLNVCVDRSEVEEPEQETGLDFSGFNINFETTRCVPSDSSYICTKKIQSNGQRKTVVIRRQCCHGYIRRTDGRPGCAALKMENLVDTIKLLEMSQFARWVDSAGVQEKLTTENFTVFVPSNEAITDYEDETEDNEISAIEPVKRMKDMSSTVQGHIIQGFVNMDHLEDEQLIDTFNGDVKIRINKYHPAQQIMTANCVPIIGKNNFATNGIVHLVSGVLPQPKQTVGDIIENDSQFSTLKKMLDKSGLMEELKNTELSWTLFAPTDDAFRKLSRALQNQIESGESCIYNVLHQHLVKGTVCTSAVLNLMKVKNNLENMLHITRDETEKLRVEGAIIDSENRLGTNGVIHSVEKVLIPPQALSLLKSLENQEREDLLKLIETADLVTTFEEIKNVTFFVPSKEAMQNLSNETLQNIEDDPELAKKILLSHLVPFQYPTTAFEDHKQLETLNGHKIHMKLLTAFPGIVLASTIQCAFITSQDQEVCGAVMHKINKVIMPPKGSILETLKELKDYNNVIKMLQTTNLDKKLDEEGPFTFLAPPDEAFERLTEESLKEILENKTVAEKILKMHILPETLCCNTINHMTPFNRIFVRTLDGRVLPLHRGLYDRVKFGSAKALQCDIPATNGLIHSVNKVFLPHRSSSPHFTFGMNLWPF